MIWDFEINEYKNVDSVLLMGNFVVNRWYK